MTTEPTIINVFGNQADIINLPSNPDDLGLVIPLPNLGLQNSYSYRAETMLAALIQFLFGTLTPANFQSNISQSIYVERGASGFTYRGENQQQYRTEQFVITLAKLDNSSVINPLDY